MLNQEQFIERVKEKHAGSNYDFSNTVYSGMHSPVTVLCPADGPFTLRAMALANGQGCRLCGIRRRVAAQWDTKEVFEEKARKVHGNLYDYSQVVYKGSKEKVEIFCPEHGGTFWQKPNVHLNGNRCGVCRPQSKMTTEMFIAKAQRKHGESRYHYEKVDYVDSLTKVIITCPEDNHGDFLQDPSNHIAGAGCPKCGLKSRVAKQNLTTDEFIERAREVHGNTYDYGGTDYRKRRETVDVLCPAHGKFRISAESHLSGYGCKKCKDNTSFGEKSLRNFIESLGYEPHYQRRNLLDNGKELDIYLPGKKLAIEYNGLYWHGEKREGHRKGKDKNYHLNKTEAASRAGIRLIQIFEDEWLEKRDIVESRLRHILGNSQETRYARKLQIRDVSKNSCDKFLEQYHIQGNTIGASSSLGLYDGDELVAVMTLGLGRYDRGSVELYRFASKGSVVGGFSKLFKAFIRRNPDVTRVISYSDRRWSQGDVYSKNGFVLDSHSAPGYFWAKHAKRHHRQSFQKHKLVNILKHFDPEKTEVENCEANGYWRVFDCGQSKWVWTRA
jgi:G:T-mismatch repair DNA endonuclease (very short patch repair protein)